MNRTSKSRGSLVMLGTLVAAISLNVIGCGHKEPDADTSGGRPDPAAAGLQPKGAGKRVSRPPLDPTK